MYEGDMKYDAIYDSWEESLEAYRWFSNWETNEDYETYNRRVNYRMVNSSYDSKCNNVDKNYTLKDEFGKTNEDYAKMVVLGWYSSDFQFTDKPIYEAVYYLLKCDNLIEFNFDELTPKHWAISKIAIDILKEQGVQFKTKYKPIHPNDARMINVDL